MGCFLSLVFPSSCKQFAFGTMLENSNSNLKKINLNYVYLGFYCFTSTVRIMPYQVRPLQGHKLNKWE